MVAPEAPSAYRTWNLQSPACSVFPQKELFPKYVTVLMKSCG